MNFYASHDFLDTLAQVYFPGQRTRIQDFEVDGRTFRFLVVGSRRVITRWTFLDYSEPLEPGEFQAPIRRSLFIQNGVHGIVPMQEWLNNPVLGSFTPAPFVCFAQFPKYEDYQSYLLKRSKDRFKKNARLRERLEQDCGQLVFTVNDNGADVLEKSLEWKSAQLRETGLPDIFRKPENWEFYRELRRRNVLLSSTLRANGRLLSSWLGYIHDGYWSGWIFTYDHDPALKKYSLGWQLMESLLSTCHSMNLKGFDFSIGHSDYKMTYGTDVRLLGDVGKRPFHEKAILSLRKQVRSKLERYPSMLQKLRRFSQRL